MSTAIRRTLGLTVLVLAIAALSLAPALAQIPGTGSDVSCDPANPDPGTQTECTAEGLEPDSAFDWEAEFAEGTIRSGSGTADAEGVGTFTVDVPDEEGDYTVTVTGTAEDGSDYEQTHEGTVGGGGSPLPLPGSSPAPSESPNPSESPSAGPSEGQTPGPGGDDDQVAPVPDGGVATGAGGLATSGVDTFQLVAGLLVLGTGGAVAFARRRRDDA